MKQTTPQLSPLAITISTMIEQKLTSVAKLTEVLHCSADSLYRRLRGETDFLLHEACVLANTLGISLDALHKLNTGFIQFNTKQLIEEVPEGAEETVTQYIQKLHKDLTLVDKLGMVQMYYAAKDLPLFAFFANKELINFKLYFWYLVLFSSTAQKQAFKLNWLPKKTVTLAEELYHLYTVNPSSEIWNFETINSTLRQVQYCVQCGLMENKDAIAVIEALKSYISSLEDSCTAGKKLGKGKLLMYLNEILILDNSVIFDLGEHQIFYMPYQTLNFFNTSDKQFVQGAIDWMSKQKARSVLISEAGDKDRVRLFKHYYKEIEKSLTLLED
jgi:hypothetical protein